MAVTLLSGEDNQYSRKVVIHVAKYFGTLRGLWERNVFS
jgi:hypothetical protein